jgi:signal transduction histidine kinase
MPDEDRSDKPVLEALNRLRNSYDSERRRIARHLHDQVAHTLVIALNSLELHEWHLEVDRKRSVTQLHRAVQAVREALDTVRALSSDLRRRDVNNGLESALSEYLRTVAPPTVHWTVTMTGYEAGLPGTVGDELYLILREAAHNSVLHAGARHLQIAVDIGSDVVHGLVNDDGKGFEVERHRAAGGLAGMRERAQLLGGELKVTSTPGVGTLVAVEIPLGYVGDQG